MEKCTPIFTIVDTNSPFECGTNCPFLLDDFCCLFSQDLDETELPNGTYWVDDAIPTRQRCARCLTFGAEDDGR